MEKVILKVPYGIQYISEWKDYQYPEGRCIVDKGVTGCGYTEYCLRNSRDIVLCSPRKLLLENKFEQHQKEGNWNVLYLENEIEDYSGVSNFVTKVRDHIYKCRGANEYGEVKPIKFLITYDSLYHLIDTLRILSATEGLSGINNFSYVVDEFQSIFLDAFFKASTEFDFVEYLQDCDNILYLSATPMLDEYLLEVPEFKDLMFYELDWSETGYTENIKLQRKSIRSISGECGKIVDRYLHGIFPTTLNKNGKPVESKEVVFYLNSVSDIIRVINKMGLTSRNTNIICSDTDDNQRKLRKIGFKIGKVPLRGETNKMFTFCTRAVYMGADFYSDCASSYVFADPNIKCLALDISLDLPQIVGRQRDKNNPFKNNITLYYRILSGNNILTKEDFDSTESQKQDSTQKLLDLFKKATPGEQKEYVQKLKDSIEVSKYSRDFVSISSKTNMPVYNKFIELADRRAWKISQVDYQDSINVTKALSELEYDLSNGVSGNYEIAFQNFIHEFEETNRFSEKLQIYCEYLDYYKDIKTVFDNIRLFVKEPEYQKYYDFYGTNGCKAKKFRKKDLEKDFINNMKNDFELIYKEFNIGEMYTSKNIKNRLGIIYASLGISKTPKATDLEKYFEVKSILIPNSETGKRDKGFKIISKKECYI